MNQQEIHNVYFIGIGGIGMSALAKYFQKIGKQVAGYDKTATPLTKSLEDKGITIHYRDAVTEIPNSFKNGLNTLVVYTPAIPNSHTELQYFIEQGFEVKKRSEVLGIITKDTFSFAVAGTHGKTTTSSILAFLLHAVKADFTAFLGGISEDFQSNFVFEGNQYSVVEADEFDRSFLRLYPNIACITSMDADHLDIYGTASELEEAFRDFAAKLGTQGRLLIRKGLPIAGITYGIEEQADYNIQNIRIQQGYYIVDIKTPKQLIENVAFTKPGRHNLLNALAAFAMAAEAGFSENAMAAALKDFAGVERRFSYQIRRDSLVYIDDYAHHPTEINAVFDAVSEMHPNLPITVVFQPHLFSRTQDFASDFASALAKFDTILLLDIYPAREEPIPGITSGWLLDQINHPQKKIVDKNQLIVELKKNQEPGILVTLGAGDIGLEVPKIKKALAYAS